MLWRERAVRTQSLLRNEPVRYKTWIIPSGGIRIVESFSVCSYSISWLCSVFTFPRKLNCVAPWSGNWNNFSASQGNDSLVHHQRRPHFPLEKSNINAIPIGAEDIECRTTSRPAVLNWTLIGPMIMMINRRLQFARSFHNIASDFAGLIVYMRQMNG